MSSFSASSGKKKTRLTPEMLLRLRRPDVYAPTFAKILDQTTENIVAYDLDRIAPALQNTILRYASDPPRTRDGYNRWLVVLASRQTGKSLTSALSLYSRTAYTSGVYSAIVADKKERAEDLFRHIDQAHRLTPAEVRMKTRRTTETRQITFVHGGKIRTLSGAQQNVGIGRGAANLHLSELPFFPNAGDTWYKLSPAFRNRKNSVIILESTPAPMSESSAEWYRDMCSTARNGGRFLFHFSPFFSSKLNQRSWDPAWSLTTEEQRLLDRFGPKGGQPVSNPGDVTYLTLENLAFRRLTFDTDALIRQFPELFLVFYPTDYITAWQMRGGGAIPEEHLDRHIAGDLVPWNPDDAYVEYKQPVAGAQYVIAIDPSGLGHRDHSAFQVLEVWNDVWEQVAVYASQTDMPTEVARRALVAAAKYNDALVVVENNGVGVGVAETLRLASDTAGVRLRDPDGEEGYYYVKHLFYDKIGLAHPPGVAASKKTHAAGLGLLIDALIDRMVLHDAETVDQLRTYRRDKEVEDGDKFKLQNPEQVSAGKRKRHHWDRVSALIWAAYGAATLPNRLRPRPVNRKGDTPLGRLPFDEWPVEDRRAFLLELHRTKREPKRFAGARRARYNKA